MDTAIAERDASAVFTALGYAVSPGELADVAAELPNEFAALLPRGARVEQPTADEFAERVARRTGVDREPAMRAAEAVVEPPAEALVHARAVLATLRETVGDEEFLYVMSELPADYKRTLVPADRRSR